MNERPGVVQRAFRIAKSGEVTSFTALHVQLAAECHLNNREALALTDVNFAMHPVPEDGHYEAWKAKNDERLNKVHS